jgi:hypothetical protein
MTDERVQEGVRMPDERVQEGRARLGEEGV